MSAPRVAFFGSPEFAVPTLEALIDSAYRPIVVVTQPDRPAGRGRALRPPAIKVVAEAAGIDVLQPPRLRDADATAALAAYAPDLQIIAAYGQILRPDVLALPRLGTLNVHASILPRWRGAAPVSAAILAGDSETGVTIMLVNEGEDTGAIMATQVEPIHDGDDTGCLGDRLARIGATLLIDTLPAWIAGDLIPVRQDDAQATRARRLTKAAGQIEWEQPAVLIARQVRAFSPWPGATTSLGDASLRVWRAHPGSVDAGSASQTDAARGPVRASGETPGVARASGETPGVVLASGETIDVATGDGVLCIERLQRAGKRTLDARAFANGEPNLAGRQLGAGA
jgi:methionyl-tRNA formyltransferase